MAIRTEKINVEQAIKNIGEELIKRAPDIANDLHGVRSITIHSEIVVDECINFDVTKNYIADIRQIGD